jgi:hypothetical protein
MTHESLGYLNSGLQKLCLFLFIRYCLTVELEQHLINVIGEHSFNRNLFLEVRYFSQKFIENNSFNRSGFL